MPAIISGIIFEDVNRNATYSPGVPGIQNVSITLQFPDNSCLQTLSNGSGNYSFTNLTVAGSYKLYETVATPTACPPTTFTQPTGYNTSTTPRVIALTVTQGQIDSNTDLNTNHFAHLTIPQLQCPTEGLQISQVPSIMSSINLITGGVVNLGTLVPNNRYNAFGYSTLNNTIYGFNNDLTRLIALTFPTTANLLAPVAGLSTQDYVIADVDFAGHYYIYANGGSTYHVIDVNPNSPTYLKNVDPSNSFQEQPSAAGFPITPIAINDWAFNPIDQNLYAITIDTGQVVRINPITMAQTFLTTTGSSAVDRGACFFDSAGNFYSIQNTDGKVFRFVLTSTTATGTFFSTALSSFNIDGTRCPLAAIDLLTITKAVDKDVTTTKSNLRYTLTIRNVSSIPVTNAIVTDTIPSGTTFVDGSLRINGLPDARNPNNGINLGTLASGTSTILTYLILVGNTAPNPNPIPNNATLAYDTGVPITSNTVTTRVLDGYRGICF